MTLLPPQLQFKKLDPPLRNTLGEKMPLLGGQRESTQACEWVFVCVLGPICLLTYCAKQLQPIKYINVNVLMLTKTYSALHIHISLFIHIHICID